MLAITLLFGWLAGSQTEISVGGTTRVSGGVAPLTVEAPSRPVVRIELLPSAGLRVTNRRNSFSAGYAPRFYWRFPNLLDLQRPLILHQLNLTAERHLSRRWQWQGALLGTTGELDYSAATRLLGGSQGALPDTEIAPYTSLDLTSAFAGVPARRHRVRLGHELGYSGPMRLSWRDGVTVDETLFPELIRLTAGPEYGYALTPQDELSGGWEIGAYWYSNNRAYLANTLQVGWARRLTRDDTFALDVGVLQATLWDYPVGQPRSQTSQWIPDGQLTLRSALHMRRNIQLYGLMTASITGFFDPIRAILEPRAGALFELDFRLPPRVSLRVHASLYTATTREPRRFPTTEDGALGEYANDQTIIAAGAPVSIMISRFWAVEAGVWTTTRGTHLAADPVRFGQFEAWAYAALTGAWGTGRRPMALLR